MAEIESAGTIGPANPDDKIKGKQTGITKVNLKNGWSTESKINQEIEIEIEQSGLTIPMKIKSEISITSK